MLTERGEHVFDDLTTRGEHVFGSLTATARYVFGEVVPPPPPTPPAPIVVAAGVSQWWPKARQPQTRWAVAIVPLQLGTYGQAWLASMAAGGTGLALGTMARGGREMAGRGQIGVALGSLGRARLVAHDPDDELMVLGLDDDDES